MNPKERVKLAKLLRKRILFNTSYEAQLNAAMEAVIEIEDVVNSKKLAVELDTLVKERISAAIPSKEEIRQLFEQNQADAEIYLDRDTWMSSYKAIKERLGA